MKPYIVLIFLLPFASCHKNTPLKFPGSYIEYLDERQILGITASGEEVWVFSSSICDTCKVPPHVSYIPMNNQLTKISNNTYKVDEKPPLSKPLKDRHGNLFAKGNNFKNIYRINGINNYSLVMETGDFLINDFVIDNDDNIWICGNKGVGCWNGRELKIYDPSNSILPVITAFELGVDTKGGIWIVPQNYAYKYLLKIQDGNWSKIEYNDIPALNNITYLSKSTPDNDGNVWFNTYVAGKSKIIKYDGNNWTVGSSENRIAIIGKDQHGTIWKTENSYTDFKVPTTLYYLKNSNWEQLNIPESKGYVFSVDVTSDSVYIGTSGGLLVKQWIK